MAAAQGGTVFAVPPLAYWQWQRENDTNSRLKRDMYPSLLQLQQHIAQGIGKQRGGIQGFIQ